MIEVPQWKTDFKNRTFDVYRYVKNKEVQIYVSLQWVVRITLIRR